MPSLDSDHVLWVTVLVGLGTAYISIPALLQQVKDAARAPPPDAAAPAKQLQKDSENSLKIETLQTLADGYSFDLRTAAIKIVASRTVRSKCVKRLLLRDLASGDFTRRDNAINGLSMLLYHPALDGGISNSFNSVATVDAVISALIHVLPLHQSNSNSNSNSSININSNNSTKQRPRTLGKLPPSPLRPLHRPAHETSLLRILTSILRQVSMGVDASGADLSPAIRRMIIEWLAHYPFPCSLPEYSNFNYKKRDVMRLFILMPSEDPLMAEIFKELQKYSGLLRPLRDAGLLGHPEMLDYPDGSRGYQWNVQPWFDEDNDVHMTDGEDTAGGGGGEEAGGVGTVGSASRNESGSGADASTGGDGDGGDGDSGGGGGVVRTTSWSLGPAAAAAARAGERSLEEEHLRRRHRQAIVVAERGTPLSRDNILQREDSRVGLQPMASGSAEGEGELNHLLGLSQDQEEHTIMPPADRPSSLPATSTHP